MSSLLSPGDQVSPPALSVVHLSNPAHCSACTPYNAVYVQAQTVQPTVYVVAQHLYTYCIAQYFGRGSLVNRVLARKMLAII